MQKIAVVTGGNRGLGLETTRQLASAGIFVVLTSRDEIKGRTAVEQLEREGLTVAYHVLDVAKPQSIDRLSRYVLEQFGRADVLVNNAGVFLDVRGSADPLILRLRETMETNVYGPLLLAEQFIPTMRKNHYGRIVNVSSGMGQLSEMQGGWPSYRISKTALNAVTRILADENKDENVLVNSVCPGWVKTDMGGAGAEKTPQQGADTIVWAATLPDGGPTGGFFRDRHSIPW